MRMTAQKVREILSYDPDTGVWLWRRSFSSSAAVGSVAGTISVHGYRIITYRGVKYRSGRLAWLYMTGEWPVNEIDHINRDSVDDRWCNLREVSRSENGLNRGLQSNNLSGDRGIHFDWMRGKWFAQVKRNNMSRFVGRFDDYNEAVFARDEASLVLNDPFCQGNLYDIRGPIAMETHS